MLDGLLEDGRIEIEGISGTSAGAINAVMVADGLARGGPQEACKRLADFWRAASLDGGLPAMQRAVIERLLAFVPFEGSPGAAVVRRAVALLVALRRSIRSTSIRSRT